MGVRKVCRLTPCGVSGLKWNISNRLGAISASLTPCGVSGLKFIFNGLHGLRGRSHPMRGEWIEISNNGAAFMRGGVSPHAG